MNRVLSFVSVLMIVCAIGAFSNVSAAPSDIVPRGDAVNDWVASLSASGVLGDTLHPSDFTTEELHTRGQLARIVESSLLNDPSKLTKVTSNENNRALLRQIVHYLQPELKLDGVDVKALELSIGDHIAGGSLTAQPEARIKVGGQDNPGSGIVGIYRADLAGTAGRALTYNLSLSNWYLDWRRTIYNDQGTHDFSQLNEAYIDLAGKNGFDLKIGRMHDNWGAAYLGGTLLSDNSPAFDQLEMSFPFSLGKLLGKNYRYTQTASTFDENGGRRYFEARRLEYQFSKRWTVDYEEAFKTSKTRPLEATPFPFLIGKSLDEPDWENYYNFSANIGANYSPNVNTRIYGQLYIDDLKSPFRGHFLGFATGNGGYTPQKLAYLIGGTTQTKFGTTLTVEYEHTDPTVYTFHTIYAPWTHGTNDWIADPAGPNSAELYGRVAQKFGSRTTIALDARDRERRDNTYPAPTAHQYGAYITQQLGRRDSVEVDTIYYQQDPFPYLPGQPGYPPDKTPLSPFSLSDPGFKQRIQQVDVSYSITF